MRATPFTPVSRKQKLVDTAGMVEKFERRYGKTATAK